MIKKFAICQSITTILDKRSQANLRNQVEYVFLRNILKLGFWNFLAEMSKFADRVVGWVHTTKSKHQVSQQLVRQLVHSLFGDNNRVPFYWWWKETVLRRKTSTNVLSKIVEIAKFPYFRRLLAPECIFSKVRPCWPDTILSNELFPCVNHKSTLISEVPFFVAQTLFLRWFKLNFRKWKYQIFP